LESLSDMTHLNVDALHAPTVTAAKVVAGCGGGAIIILAAVAALLPARFRAIYGATKAFGLALTQAVASFDQRQAITLSSPAEVGLWEKAGKARAELVPHLSLKFAARRFVIGVSL
jgi:NADP-dependent 3-hydroxy acid dehydrogenase YdfG